MGRTGINFRASRTSLAMLRPSRISTISPVSAFAAALLPSLLVATPAALVAGPTQAAPVEVGTPTKPRSLDVLYVRATTPAPSRHVKLAFPGDAPSVRGGTRAHLGLPSGVVARAERAVGDGMRARAYQPVSLGTTLAFVVVGTDRTGRAAMAVVRADGRVLATRRHVAAAQAPLRLRRQAERTGGQIWRTEVGRHKRWDVTSEAVAMRPFEAATVEKGSLIGMEQFEEDEYKPTVDAMEQFEEDEYEPAVDAMEQFEEDEIRVGVWGFSSGDAVAALDATANFGASVVAPLGADLRRVPVVSAGKVLTAR